MGTRYHHLPRVCTRCAWYGYPRIETSGNAAVGIVLLFFFVIPGIIYFVWMGNSEHSVCDSCGAKDLVDPDSPVGRDLLHRFHAELFAKGVDAPES